MKTPLRTAVAAAAIAGAGLAGFGLTAAFAQTDDGATTTTEVPADAAGRPDGACEGRGPGLDAMAEVIGIDAEELRAALEEGQTPAEVAEANGVSRADLVDAIVTSINSHIDQAVEDGHLTEAEAEERRAEVQEHAEGIADGERPEGMGPRGRPGGPPFSDEDAPAEDTTADA